MIECQSGAVLGPTHNPQAGPGREIDFRPFGEMNPRGHSVVLAVALATDRGPRRVDHAVGDRDGAIDNV
jgi:hypothetical protein